MLGYTCCNNQQGLSRILVRLDRGFGNQLFNEIFPNFQISHLHRAASDHAPLLLNFNPCYPSRRRSFKFEHFWFSHPGLKDVILKA